MLNLFTFVEIMLILNLKKYEYEKNFGNYDARPCSCVGA